MFRAQISIQDLNDICEATNKAWVLGSDRFKDKIEKQLGRASKPKARGGDRRSVQYKNTNR